jgi:hypothetical protein
MAITVAIVCDQTSVESGQPVNVTMTVTNSGASAVTVSNVEAGAGLRGALDGSQNSNPPVHSAAGYPTVPGSSGTLVLKWQVVPFCAGESSVPTAISYVVYTTDGTASDATATASNTWNVLATNPRRWRNTGIGVAGRLDDFRQSATSMQIFFTA